MDYRRQAIDELRHIAELRTAEKICRDRLSELNDRLQTLKIPSPQTDPVQGGGNKTEERWLNIIAAKSDEECRYRDVRRRLKRFNAAWAALSDRDRGVLQEWYIEKGNYDRAESVSNKEHCGRATAYRWRDDAIINYARAYFGAVVE